MIKVSEIPFAKLRELDDNESIILSGMTLDGVDSIEEIDKFFHESAPLFSEDKHIIAVSKVSNNVRGDEGRTDLLLHLTKEGTINVMVRLQLRSSGMPVMWTSDFVDNCSNDYFDEVG